MRYIVYWFGKFYEEDTDGRNSKETNSWRAALVEFTFLNDNGFKCYITDNKYGCTLCWDRDREKAYWD